MTQTTTTLYHCHDVCATTDEHHSKCEALDGCDYAEHAFKDGGTVCRCSGCAEVAREEYGCNHPASALCTCIEDALYG